MVAKNCGNQVTAAVRTGFIPLRQTHRPAILTRSWISALFLLTLLGCNHAEKLDLTRLKLPPGFNIAVFAKVPNAREMAFSPGGVLLVTDTSDGTVLALPDAEHSGRAERAVPVLSGLNAPHGIAFHNGKTLHRGDQRSPQLRLG